MKPILVFLFAMLPIALPMIWEIDVTNDTERYTYVFLCISWWWGVMVIATNRENNDKP